MNDQLTSYLNEYLTMQTPQFALGSQQNSISNFL